MNHVFRNVWNEITRTYAAEAETVKGRGKKSRSSKTASPVGLVRHQGAAGEHAGRAVAQRSQCLADPGIFLMRRALIPAAPHRFAGDFSRG